VRLTATNMESSGGAPASRIEEDVDDFVEVVVGRSAQSKIQRSSSASIEAAADGGSSTPTVPAALGSAAQQQHASGSFFWLLFVVGWIFPPCWWYGAAKGMQCSNRRLTARTSLPATAAWRACVFMACASAIALILGFSIYYGTKTGKLFGYSGLVLDLEACRLQCKLGSAVDSSSSMLCKHRNQHHAGDSSIYDVLLPCYVGASSTALEEHKYFYSISGPTSSFIAAPSAETGPIVAKALHKVLALPAAYPVANIKVDLLKDAPMLTSHRHLLEATAAFVWAVELLGINKGLGF